MPKLTAYQFVAALFVGLALFPPSPTEAAEAAAKDKAAKWASAVAPKPLSNQVKSGLQWLVQHQLPNGAWNQGEESAAMGGQLLDKPSVADTCIATLALLRAGNTPQSGEYASNVKKAIDFVSKEVIDSKDDTLFVTENRATRVQSKIGTYIDTFMACMLLSEVKGKMPDTQSEARVDAALTKVLQKIAKFQRADGTWGNEGWAPTLSQAMAAKGLNRAAQAGAKVDETTRVRTEKYARQQFDDKSQSFKAEGSAGVALYASSGSLGAMQDSENTNVAHEQQAREILKTSKDKKERQSAEETIQRIEENRKDLASAKKAIAAKMEDKQFVEGFGSNGGEEYLSYLNIGESLVVKGGPEWEKWDKSMTGNLNRVQNQDGSWTGHHCITGRTFCTAAALLVLTVDRAPVPVAREIKGR